MADVELSTVARGRGSATSAKISGPTTDDKPRTVQAAPGLHSAPSIGAMLKALPALTEQAWSEMLAARYRRPPAGSFSTPWKYNSQGLYFYCHVGRLAYLYKKSGCMDRKGEVILPAQTLSSVIETGGNAVQLLISKFQYALAHMRRARENPHYIQANVGKRRRKDRGKKR